MILSPSMTKLILLNKPYHVLSQFEDQAGRATLKDYVPIKGVYPAGRLDYDSEGLLLLTDCGKLQHRISHPNNKMAKTYYVQVENIPTEDDLDRIRQGLKLKNTSYLPAKITKIAPPELWPRTLPIRQRKLIPTCWLKITVKEGKNRQIRKMTAAIGYPTLRLIRIQIGDWHIAQLQPGQYLIT